MHVLNPRGRRIIGIASLTVSVVFGTLSIASLPAGAQAPAAAALSCPVLSVGNPNAGDDLLVGDYFASGTAFDPAAPAGTSGISRIDLFLGERENGGTLLATTTTGTSASGDPRAFSAKITLPSTSRGVDFAVYATSSITGQETAVTFPVFVGVPAKFRPAQRPRRPSRR